MANHELHESVPTNIMNDGSAYALSNPVGEDIILPQKKQKIIDNGEQINDYGIKCVNA